MNSSGPRCCMRTGCFDCMKTSEYIETTPILTPYFRPVISTQDIADGVPAPETSYLPYDLFAFRSKFERFLYQFNPTYHFAFVKKELENMMRVTIELFKGDTFVPLNESTASIIQDYVDKSVVTYPAHVLLFDARVQLERGNKILSKAWVASLIPFFAFEERFHAIIENGKIYISLVNDLEYVDRYERMYTQVVNTIFEYYERGVVPLSTRFHSQIIKDFKLDMIHQQYVSPGEEDLPGELKLYEPSWRNQYFAPNPVQFLYDRLQGNEDLKILVGDNFVRRHYVAVALTKLAHRKFATYEALQYYIPTFAGKYVYVPAITLLEAFEITDIVISAQSQSEGKIEVIALENPEKYEQTVANLTSKYKTLIPGEDIILYRTIDIPNYVASFLLPTGMAVDALKILKK